MRMDGQIDFVEFPGHDLRQMRRFYGAAFGWTFEDKDPGYVAFHGAGAEGGFCADPARGPVEPLVVLYVLDLEAARARVIAVGGEITKDIFACPGGRRFHFRDPGENEVAVWSEVFPDAAAAAIGKPQRLFDAWGRRGATPIPVRPLRHLQAVDLRARAA